MEEKKFNLSEKRITPHKDSVTQFQAFYSEKDVKEFIKLLFEYIEENGTLGIEYEIKYLAGDKLI